MLKLKVSIRRSLVCLRILVQEEATSSPFAKQIALIELDMEPVVMVGNLIFEDYCRC